MEISTSQLSKTSIVRVLVQLGKYIHSHRDPSTRLDWTGREVPLHPPEQRETERDADGLISLNITRYLTVR